MKVIRVKCGRPDCEYEWDYKGERKYPAMVTCPQCYGKVRLPDPKGKGEQKKQKRKQKKGVSK